MSVNKIKQEIGKVERSIEVKQQNLDRLRQRITEEVKPFVNPQLKESVEREVHRNSEHTKELGRDNLSAMKQSLIALLDSSDSLVEKVLTNNDFWMHVNYCVGDDRYAYGIQEEAKRKIYKGIKIILGEAGKLLIDYGYIQTGAMYRWDGDTRRSLDLVNSNPQKSDLVYIGAISLPKSLSQLMEEYVKEVSALHELCIKTMELKEDLSRQEAIDLWEEV